jgi:phage terminase large subunit-like protein
MALTLNLKKLKVLHQETLTEILNDLQLLRESEQNQSWESYKPLMDISPFHKSQAQTRVLIGGNRSGKSEGGVMEMLWYAKGRHPYRSVLAPCHIWMVALDSEVLGDVILPKVWKYLKEGEIKRWNSIQKVLELKNGTVIKFKSCDSGASKFQSAECRLIWFDEEPPEDVYKECRVRVGASDPLDIIMTFTPLKGMDWTYEEIVEKQQPGKIEVFGASMMNNHHIPLSERKRLKEEWEGTPDEAARLHGDYFERSGRIYRGLEEKIHLVDPFEIPRDWPHIRAIDPHPRKPSAAVWVAISPDNAYYICEELNDPNEMLLSDFVGRIKVIDAQKRIIRSIIDPSSLQRNMVTGDSIRDHLRRLGMSTSLATNDIKVGYDRVRSRINSPTGTKLFVFRTCPKTWWQLKHLVYDEWKSGSLKDPKETQRKINDDLADCVRYICAEDISYSSEQNELAYRELEDRSRSSKSFTGYSQ